MILPAILQQNIETFGEYTLLYYQGREYTNVETLRQARRIAAALRKTGVQPGDRVMVCMPNSPEVIFAYHGISRTGAVIVPILFLLHAHEIAYIARNSGTKLIFTGSLVLPKIREAIQDLPNPPLVVVVDAPTGDGAVSISDWLADVPADPPEPEISIQPDDTAVILYTSGTTGRPKGVILTHRNLYSNAATTAAENDGERDTTIGVLPLAHVYGLTVSNVLLLTGSSIVVFPKFDPVEVFRAIERHRVRFFSAVPAMLHAMVTHPQADQFDLSSLERVGSGSAPLPLTLVEAFKQKFGADVYDGYGLSEAAPIVASYRKDMEYRPGSVGKPIPSVEVRIVDDEDRELPPGEVGELIVRGENVTPGYFQNEEETRRALRGGWLHTGDLAKLDEDGYLYIVGRKKDLIIRGGFNIYPRDIEELLTEHPAVAEAAVIGVPDERMGEEVVAYVVRRPGAEVTEQELITFCQDRLAKYKTPRRVLFLDDLPRNGVGKVLKTVLREMAKDVELRPAGQGEAS
ncbi:MAG: long-chain fatty acid--CoA ligase [Thermoflavifilum sp.]|nr:long-chain fatty acid--CoA ligase [Thermoflavifilum sp.]MCL6513616.1 long-chain fatty acid--CoA ligase [Alicyclobacillus sp.]